MSPRPRPWVIALALALFAVLTLLRVLVDDADAPGPVVYTPSVALLALELGAFSGLLAGGLATALFYVTIDEVSAWDLGFRAAALLTLGALVGVLGSRLRAARAVARAAREINDNVIQSLVLAKYALDRRELAEASDRVDETLREAREIIERLVGAEDVRPGALRRDGPARVR